MLCYKNGSLSRVRIKDAYFDGDWTSFNHAFERTDLPTSENKAITIFSFDKPEILPGGVSGVHVFREGKYVDGGETDLTDGERQTLARRVVESQFMSFRKRVGGILKEGETLRRVFVAGGGSVK